MRAREAFGAKGKRSLVWILAALLALVALAGCFHGSDDENGEDPIDTGNGDDDPTDPIDTPEPPETPEPLLVLADITADRQAGWAVNDTWTYDASNSTVVSGDGNITRWTFTFGDGSDPVIIEAGDDPVVEHEFEEGGVYLVNVTVEAESADGNETASDTASVGAFVSQRFILEGDAAGAFLIVSDAEPWNETFKVGPGAIGYNVTLDIEDGATIGSSEGTVSFLDPEGETLGEAELEEGEVTFGGQFDPPVSTLGEYELRVDVESGEVEFTGELAIFYGVDPATLE